MSIWQIPWCWQGFGSQGSISHSSPYINGGHVQMNFFEFVIVLVQVPPCLQGFGIQESGREIKS